MVLQPQIVSNTTICSLSPDWKCSLCTMKKPLDRAASESGTKDNLIPMIEGQKLPKKLTKFTATSVLLNSDILITNQNIEKT